MKKSQEWRSEMRWLGLFLILLLNSGCVLANPAKTKFTVRVLNAETDEIITNAAVLCHFTQKRDPWGNGTGKSTRVKQVVDANGETTIENKTIQKGTGATAFADGFYTDSAGLKFTGKNTALNRWEPWNPTIEVKMRPKKNPVPMINKRVESSKIPVWEKDLGFDLEKGDWVDPYGIGTQSDFFVNMVRRFEHSGDYDAVATIRFPNEGDGIQRYEVPDEFQSSSFKFPYKAPLDGYQDKLILERHATLRKTECNFNPKTDLYIFRVRTELDADGNVVSACYGRTTGRIEIGWGEVFDFSYFFNTNSQSRSLESDEKPY
ncbi:hypothetical protein EGM51_17005 [Verrucomicrobia bacterium S94]|nr:hypothetical protein EGM51_17005 [Verrucomicrobia bacterium S94]